MPNGISSTKEPVPNCINSAVILSIRWFWGHSKRQERRIPSGNLCRDRSVSNGRGSWLLYVLNIWKGNDLSQVELQLEPTQKNCNVRNQESWRLKNSIPNTKNGDNYTPLNKNAMWFSSNIYYLIRFLKTWTIKAVLDFWKRIMSGIVSQNQLKLKNTFRSTPNDVKLMTIWCLCRWSW